MLILHTSDWHLSNRLMDHNRLAEHRAFFRWLLELTRERRPDLLLVSGDLFDSSTPGDRAQELLCDFLSRADACGCGRVVLTAGNHDGVSTLRKIRPLLQRYHADLITDLGPENAEDCRITLQDGEGKPCATLYAVPYLRPADVALAVPADAPREERESAYTRGVAALYARLAEDAREQKRAHGGPAIAMGHLSLIGARSTSSTRQLIGTLEGVGCDIFDPVFDYVALGHYHAPSSFEQGRIAYSGSPLALSVDEGEEPRRVLLVKLDEEGVKEVQPVEVPRFALHVRLEADGVQQLEELPAQLAARVEEARRGGAEEPELYLQVDYGGGDLTLHELRERLDAMQAQAGITAYRARLRRDAASAALDPHEEPLPLSQFTPEDLLLRCLRERQDGGAGITEEQRKRMLALFRRSLDAVLAAEGGGAEPGSAGDAASEASRAADGDALSAKSPAKGAAPSSAEDAEEEDAEEEDLPNDG